MKGSLFPADRISKNDSEVLRSADKVPYEGQPFLEVDQLKRNLLDVSGGDNDEIMVFSEWRSSVHSTKRFT